MTERPTRRYDYLRNNKGHAPGLILPADKGKLDALATVNLVAAPLTLVAGVLDITPAAPGVEGSMSGADKAKLDQLATDTGWTGLSYSTNWTNLGFGNSNGQYKKDALGCVVVTGVAAKSTAFVLGETIATLPAGFRPTAAHIFTCTCPGGFSDVRVSTGGAISVQATTGTPGTWQSLELRFDPAT